MYFSGKITNSFFTFLNRYDLDTSRFFAMTPLEIDFIRDPYSWMDASQVELLLRNIERAYQNRFIDKNLVTTVGHNAPHLKAWGGLDDSLSFFDNLKALYEKIDKFLSYFISPQLRLYDKKDCKEFFSFKTNFPKTKYPTVKDYLLSVLEACPVFLGEEQTEVTWEDETVKIYLLQEKTLILPFKELHKKGIKKSPFIIKQLKAREVIDSRGEPTLEVDLILQNNCVARAIVPSGASKGKLEAKELRDSNSSYFFYKGLKKACKNTAYLSTVLKGKNVQDQENIDKLLIKQDGTKYKENLGANTLLGVSLACLKGAANASIKPLYQYASLYPTDHFLLPVPLMNIINGGLHASNNLDIQEFMIVPLDFPSFKEALRAGCEVFYQLKCMLKDKGFSCNVGDEGGFSPDFSSTTQAFDFILLAIEKCSYTGRIALALDCASSQFYKKKHYFFEGNPMDSKSIIAMYEKWSKQYPIISIEDGLAEEDWNGWRQLTHILGNKLQLVGDDLLVTSTSRIKKALAYNAANALLVKYNQAGTITETKQAFLTAKKAGMSCIFSHRSGDTEDTSIADLSVAWGAEQIKTGAPSRGERTAKYNRLLRIEEELGGNASFKSKKAFKNTVIQYTLKKSNQK